jgi:hypothetical protein
MTTLFIATKCSGCPIFSTAGNFGNDGVCVFYDRDIKDTDERCKECVGEHPKGVKITIGDNDMEGVTVLRREET